jgi:tetratricopeptide (TPR) repeat protein
MVLNHLSPMKDIPPIWRLVVAFALSGLLLWWAFAMRQQELGRRGILRDLADRERRALVADVHPPFVEGLLRASIAAERDVLPPDHARSERMLRQAIPLDPLRPALWLRLANLYLLTGRPDQAAAALRRSDELDPFYPRARLEAITLWTLLGEDDRAAEIGRRIARLGEEFPIEVARRLRLAGFQPEAVLGIVRPELRSPVQLAGLLGALQSGRPEPNRRLIESLTTQELAEPAVRLRAAQIALNPLQGDLLTELWHLHTNSELLPTTPGSLVLTHALPPHRVEILDSDFPIGWQRPPSAPLTSVTIQPIDADLSDTPTLALALRFDQFPGDLEGRFRWTWYRLYIPAGQAVALPVSVRIDPPELTRLVIRAEWQGGRSSVAPANPDSPDWQRLRLAIPAADVDRIVSLTLERERRPGLRMGTGRAWLLPGADW